MNIASGGSLILPAVPDLVWGTVCFVIVAIAVARYAWPTFMKTLDERARQIDDGLNAAARAEEDIARQRAALADDVVAARREAAEIREKAQATASAIVEEAKKTAAVEAQRVSANAQRQIEADAQAAKTQLRQDVGSLASELAGRIVGQQVLDPTVSSNIIDSFLDELEADNAVLGASTKVKGN